MAKSFRAQLKDIQDLTVGNMRYVAAEAIQDVMEAAQTPQVGVTKGAEGFEEGKIPVAENDLIASLSSRISSGAGSAGEDSYVTALAGFEIGDRLEFEWTAAHALPMEAGFKIQKKDGTEISVPGRHFVGKNAARFSDFVEKHSEEVKK